MNYSTLPRFLSLRSSDSSTRCKTCELRQVTPWLARGIHASCVSRWQKKVPPYAATRKAAERVRTSLLHVQNPCEVPAAFNSTLQASTQYQHEKEGTSESLR